MQGTVAAGGLRCEALRRFAGAVSKACLTQPAIELWQYDGQPQGEDMGMCNLPSKAG